MKIRHISRRIPVLVACLCCGLLSIQAHAERPLATVRFFIEILPLDQECQDWEAEASRRIVAHPNPKTSGHQQGIGDADYVSYFDAELYLIHDDEENLLLDLRNTSWIRTPVMHLGDGGAELVRDIYWVDTEPENSNYVPNELAGATAATGPDGDVNVLRTYRVDTGSDGRLYINNTSGSYQIRISMGLFQR